MSTLACLSCERILEAGEAADHFRHLGLDPQQPFDADVAEASYLRLSRILHPDFQTQADEHQKQLALRNSSLLNEAWRKLSNDQTRTEFLVELHDPGVLERQKKLSPDFLMEAMELSEELDDAHAIGCTETIRRIADLARTEIADRMQGAGAGCSRTMERISHDDHVPEQSRGTRLLGNHQWNSEQIAVLLHQARVYRRILKDAETRR